MQTILNQSVDSLLGQQDSQGGGSFPAHLGSRYISLYALFLEWLRFRGFSSRLDLNRLAGVLLKTQLPDGSWRQARDPALPSGDINATVVNYAALKFFRTSISGANVEPAIHSARRFTRRTGAADSRKKGLQWLLNRQNSDGGWGAFDRNNVETRDGSASWRDGSVVGTGHPGILYMEYPAYPRTFPVMALANYSNLR